MAQDEGVLPLGALLGASTVEAPDEPIVADEISGGELLQGALVLLVSVLLAVLLRQLLVRLVDREADRHLGRVLGRFLSVVVVGVGAVYGLDVMGVRVAPLLGALGVGGIALAFAAQDILQNLIAGVLLQVRRPLRLGDQVKSGEYEGVVEDINLRALVLTTYDGLTVFLPNAEVLKNPIVNYTRTPTSRTELVVGVAYSTDLEQARAALLRAAAQAPEVRASPPPEAWVFQFGESSIDIAVRYWHPADIASRWRVRNAVAVAVKRELDAEGITIPFPQRTLWFGPGNQVLTVAQQQQAEQSPEPRARR